MTNWHDTVGRRGERSEAIQSCLAWTLDCFVAALLAMTEKAMLLAMTG
jgi:hypothetical protein